MRADVELPDDLKTVLSVVAGGILEGHLKLAAALRKRYEDQYPLVRSLADVFTAHVSCVGTRVLSVFAADVTVIHLAGIRDIRVPPRTGS